MADGLFLLLYIGTGASVVKEKVKPAGESLMYAVYDGERAPGEEVSYPCQAHMTKLS